MLTRCINRIFALDGRSTVIEYGIITVLLAAALLSGLVALSDTVTEVYVQLVGDAVASTR